MMKKSHAVLVAALALVATPFVGISQDDDSKKKRPERGGERAERGERGSRGGPGGGGRGGFTFPLMKALDADSDGKISAEEIDGAVAALKKLDKDGDGSLSRAEYMGDRFGGRGRGGRGQGGGRPGGNTERPKRPASE